MQNSSLTLVKNRFRKLILCFPFNPNKVNLVEFEKLADDRRDAFSTISSIGILNKRRNFWNTLYNELSEFGKFHDTGEKFIGFTGSYEPLISKFGDFAKSIAYNITKCKEDNVSSEFVSKTIFLLQSLLFYYKNQQPLSNNSEEQNSEFFKYFKEIFGLEYRKSIKNRLFTPKEYIDYINKIFELYSDNININFDGETLSFSNNAKINEEKEDLLQIVSEFEVTDKLDVEKGLVFILMAMDKDEFEDLDDILNMIKKAVNGVRNYDGTKLNPNRIDDFLTIPKITPAILDNIKKSEYIISNITHKKPNVFYEIGYAHAFDKKVIITAKIGTKVDFDIKDCPIDFYTNLSEMEKKIKDRLRAFIKEKKNILKNQ